eukprot:11155102-Lingulodinium_polyedra.AAC.1
MLMLMLMLADADAAVMLRTLFSPNTCMLPRTQHLCNAAGHTATLPLLMAAAVSAAGSWLRLLVHGCCWFMAAAAAAACNVPRTAGGHPRHARTSSTPLVGAAMLMTLHARVSKTMSRHLPLQRLDACARAGSSRRAPSPWPCIAPSRRASHRRGLVQWP